MFQLMIKWMASKGEGKRCVDDVSKGYSATCASNQFKSKGNSKIKCMRTR